MAPIPPRLHVKHGSGGREETADLTGLTENERKKEKKGRNRKGKKD
jgi:hypothetical protein